MIQRSASAISLSVITHKVPAASLQRCPQLLNPGDQIVIGGGSGSSLIRYRPLVGHGNGP
ncbi:hypothetical protein C7U65_33815 [Bradyrhizobium sp. WBAH23]|nr:hypothetical protein [Bradyrhizobium sp. WBAH30]MDD1546346.1 hypothetical protein [Bradyrhizobium sp. WBAH41]MDD1560510.1 hypothetical protein [Bradyrhizobium sp. WBAH23]MDD1567353.1 hypothetical protein [Bradyrhizobium sp. WBAH33]MDD1594163.1 hypothetical protein [Bradyrhizobium sp. WBAH42]NRB90837.1 hypothetical protein [Bradyrhizobium sp. WBAH10]QCJ93526.1 hypothetical protein DAA57_37680 [Bradyrhizobium yuanmingense]